MKMMERSCFIFRSRLENVFREVTLIFCSFVSETRRIEAIVWNRLKEGFFPSGGGSCMH